MDDFADFITAQLTSDSQRAHQATWNKTGTEIPLELMENSVAAPLHCRRKDRIDRLMKKAEKRLKRRETEFMPEPDFKTALERELYYWEYAKRSKSPRSKNTHPPVLDFSRPLFSRDPSFPARLYEFPITIVFPKHYYTEREAKLLGGLRQDGMLLIYRKSGFYHTTTYISGHHYHEGKIKILYQDGYCRDIDHWSDQKFCEHVAWESAQAGMRIEFIGLEKPPFDPFIDEDAPESETPYFSSVDCFSDKALKAWAMVLNNIRLARSADKASPHFDKGFVPFQVI